jgi:HD superfamily phosphohydrolase
MSLIDPLARAGTGFAPDAVVRDALYDRIPLAPPEQALIGTPTFLRLDGIQQLGFVSRIWPGATHTRFAHSLGVMHLTRLAVTHLMAQPEGREITPDDARAIVAAALLHDIGHYPYSHAIEELGPPVLPHEEVGSRLIQSGEIAVILKDLWSLDPVRVAALVHGGDACLSERDRMLRGLLSGTLDMDKLDYLPRDALACNVPYGGVDTTRLIDALDIAEIENGDRRRRLVVTDKGVSPLHSLINARQEMFDNVYWHHTNRACMIMLLRAVQEAIIAGAIDAGTLTNLNDASLMALLRSPAMPSSTRRLAGALAERRIHKRAVEVSNRAIELYGRLGNLWFDPAARREVELQLVAGLTALTGEKVAETDVLIDIPKPERWKTDVWVQFEQPPVGLSPLMHWKDVVGLGDADFKRYEEHRRLIRIVTAPRWRETMRANWERLLLPHLGDRL